MNKTKYYRRFIISFKRHDFLVSRWWLLFEQALNLFIVPFLEKRNVTFPNRKKTSIFQLRILRLYERRISTLRFLWFLTATLKENALIHRILETLEGHHGYISTRNASSSDELWNFSNFYWYITFHYLKNQHNFSIVAAKCAILARFWCWRIWSAHLKKNSHLMSTDRIPSLVYDSNNHK